MDAISGAKLQIDPENGNYIFRMSNIRFRSSTDRKGILISPRLPSLFTTTRVPKCEERLDCNWVISLEAGAEVGVVVASDSDFFPETSRTSSSTFRTERSSFSVFLK